MISPVLNVARSQSQWHDRAVIPPSKKPIRRLPKDDVMFDRFMAGDARYDGIFFTGVRSTGIYCIPSCKARKPLRKNVEFFADCAGARAAGYRPCRKCHPDDFEAGVDPVRETIERTVADVRTRPEAFTDIPSVVRHSGYGTTRFFELLRLHYHLTPAELLLRSRLDRACRLLLDTESDLLSIANEVGFGAPSTFHEQFRTRFGLTPDSYRQLRKNQSFTLALPSDFRWDYFRRFLERDSSNPSLRLNGDHLTWALHLEGETGIIFCRIHSNAIEVKSPELPAPKVHRWLVHLLGFDQDTTGFVRLARKLGVSRLVKHTEGLRLPQEGTAFEALVWGILGQQITVSFATILRRRLIERCGFPADEGLIAHPTPERVLEVPAEEWIPLQFSRQKTRYLRSLCLAVKQGSLNLDTLAASSATFVERTLLAQDGLGPWTVNYVMMRALGFMDCVPYGDTGVTSGLQALFKTETRPNAEETRRLLAPFSPLRSLAVAHLWQFNRS